MGEWGKYGDPSEIELHVGEPAFVLRAQDALAPYALQSYAALLRATAAGVESGASHALEHFDLSFERGEAEKAPTTLAATLRGQAEEVEERAARMIAWQTTYGVKLPD